MSCLPCKPRTMLLTWIYVEDSFVDTCFLTEEAENDNVDVAVECIERDPYHVTGGPEALRP